jgi:hypothetical protein
VPAAVAVAQTSAKSRSRVLVSRRCIAVTSFSGDSASAGSRAAGSRDDRALGRGRRRTSRGGRFRRPDLALQLRPRRPDHTGQNEGLQPLTVPFRRTHADLPPSSRNTTRVFNWLCCRSSRQARSHRPAAMWWLMRVTRSRRGRGETLSLLLDACVRCDDGRRDFGCLSSAVRSCCVSGGR